jgi:DHA2 family multidrug resistance protein
VNHASLAAHVTPFDASLRLSDIQRFWDIHSQAGLAALDAELNRQAAMIAYIDDFKLMMIITLAMAPLLLLLRGAEKGAAETGRAVALD